MENIKSKDPRIEARHLYWSGWRISRIAESLGEKPATVHSWKRRDEWDKKKLIERVEESLESRYIFLLNKDKKEGIDFKEIDLLSRQMERVARINKYNGGGNEADLNPNIASRNKAERKKATKNDFNDEHVDLIKDAFMDSLFAYQHGWFEAGKKHSFRNVLKSRQIGATWYFAREALFDAMTTGRNQIFLSASKAQAHVFKQYIIAFAKDAADLELKGDPIVLPNGATLHFLGTNARTAQSYTGNLYVDEYFWIPRFQELQKVASGMALHSHWRQTYFSTPSSLNHDAYPFWSGDAFNKGRVKADRILLDVKPASLAKGRLCEDDQWRQVVTIENAIEGGCNLFDLDKIKKRYNPNDYQNLLMCEFIDDSASIFPLAELQKCMVDSWEKWEDFKAIAPRPFGHRPVWLGYDPALSGDSAGLIVLAPPLVPDGKFRVLEKRQWKGMDFAAQAEGIKQICSQYNVAYIGIDTTGIGQGVYQLVKQFYPAARAINYSVEMKGRLVMKAQDVIRKGRLEFDAGWTDLAAAFMAIQKTMTASGRQVTYSASRSEELSHADLAWACMHALLNEPLEGSTSTNSGFMAIY
ncbi:terminase ATPase subunit family protein [Iodobacter sp. HSC-16F04]|uniref:Terminase ATPase subunit family protein n=1 Tax=Iodobacter violaceini TaxID=3044271 RepID=A0ABX0KL57_9NEIS|nr:terminase ATPase subunit family protein [Iodobacter violacea]NHQ84875.1 terminase ATPase subunit family protein [Iodobacter violacea]